MVEMIQDDLKQVTSFIKESVTDADELVKKPLRQTILNSGKMIRPSMMIWAANCGTCTRKMDLLKAAAAIELLHISSLIHDDIVDDGKIRRGLPSVRSLFGNSVAVYTGDYTIVKCYRLLHESGNDNLIYDFIMATEKLCKSEIIQYQKRGEELKVNQYMKIAVGKTGALFALAMKVGARLGGFDEKTCDKFAELGEAFGIAFQIADDCLDINDGKGVSKSVRNDLRHGHYTLPLILVLNQDDGYLRTLLREEEKTDEAIDKICRYVYTSGGIQLAKAEIRKITQNCRKLLLKLPNKSTNNYLSNLLDSMEV